MKTKQEIIANFKQEYPTLRSGDDERGYENLNPADYEATILEWADNQLADEVKAAEAAQATTDKAALLSKLGITEEEARLLLL